MGCDTTGGDTIKVTFSREVESSEVNITIGDSDDPCEVSQAITSGERLECTLPESDAGSKDVFVRIGAEQDTMENSVQYVDPGDSCPPGQGVPPGSPLGVCKMCDAGTFGPFGQDGRCEPCFQGTFAAEPNMTTCEPCPTSWGIECDGGRLVLSPGFWSPCALTPKHADCAKFDTDTVLYTCLSPSACNVTSVTALAAAGVSLTPSVAFNCTAGHRGALCAECSEGFYFRRKVCHACAEEFLPHTTVAAIVSVLSLAVLLALFKLAMHKYAGDMLRALHRLRRALRPLLGLSRAARRRRQRMARFERRRRSKRGGNKAAARPSAAARHARDLRDEAAYALHVERHGAPGGARVRLRATAVKLVHAAVKATQAKVFACGESLRIVLNIFKVLSHMYSGLARCTRWPVAIENFAAVAALFTLDLFTETKLPCARYTRRLRWRVCIIDAGVPASHCTIPYLLFVTGLSDVLVLRSRADRVLRADRARRARRALWARLGVPPARRAQPQHDRGLALHARARAAPRQLREHVPDGVVGGGAVRAVVAGHSLSTNHEDAVLVLFVPQPGQRGLVLGGRLYV